MTHTASLPRKKERHNTGLPRTSALSEYVSCSLEISTGRDFRVAHGLHIYFSEYVSRSLEISTGRDFRVGRPVYIFISLSMSVVLLKFPWSRVPFTDRGRTL